MGNTTTMNEWELLSDYTPKRGDIVKCRVGVGVAVDVFTSQDTGRVMLEVHYPKNAAQRQSPEFGLLGMFHAIDIAPATIEELQAEMKMIFDKRAEQYQERVNELLAYAGMEPIHVNPII